MAVKILLNIKLFSSVGNDVQFQTSSNIFVEDLLQTKDVVESFPIVDNAQQHSFVLVCAKFEIS